MILFQFCVAGTRKKRKTISNPTMHAQHLSSMETFERINGVSSTVLQNEEHQKKQYILEEAGKGRAASLLSKSSMRRLQKIRRSNSVITKKADNKCQDQARVKARCVRNAYSTAVVRFVERMCKRKDVSAAKSREVPV